MRSRRIATIGLALALSLGLSLPAVAEKPDHIPDHKSCQGFGEVFRDWAQGGAQELGFKNGGQGIKSTAHDGLFVEGVIDAQPPGSVAEVIHWEHSWACEGG
jgi:hypothetical protein